MPAVLSPDLPDLVRDLRGTYHDATFEPLAWNARRCRRSSATCSAVPPPPASFV